MSFFRSLTESITPLLVESRFYEAGMMTADEFVKAGDQLIASCATWEWASGLPGNRKSYLPADKQYLITRKVPSTRRAHTYLADGLESQIDDGSGSEWTMTHADKPSTHPDTSSTNSGEGQGGEGGKMGEASTTSSSSSKPVDDSIPEIRDSDDEDEGGFGLEETDGAAIVIAGQRVGPQGTENKDAAVMRVTEPEEKVVATRTYDLTVVYDNYYRTPRVYLLGYDEKGNLLTEQQITQDVSADHAGKTLTWESHPHTGVHNLCIHPCQHASTMKRLLDAMYERELELIQIERSAKDAQEKKNRDLLEKDKELWAGVTKSEAEVAAAAAAPVDKAKAAEEMAQEAKKALQRKMPVENYFFLFLKFIAGVLPTIEYDFTLTQRM